MGGLIKKASLAGALLAALLPGAVLAQDYAPDKVVNSVELADLKAIVLSLGHSVEEEGVFADEHSRSLRAVDPDGVKYLLIGTACDKNDVSGCQGIMMQVRYDIPEEATLEQINAANLRQAAINTWIDRENNTLGFTRYQVLDHGVTMANIRDNILVLMDIHPLAYDIATGAE